MRRSASQVIRNLERRIARLEKSTMKKASTDMPSEAESQLLDEIYDETNIQFDESEIVQLDVKTSVYYDLFLVKVAEYFAVVRCIADDEPNSWGCEVVVFTTNKRDALRAFR